MNSPLSAIIYTRVSADRAGGRSVAEQEAECRAECERRGWPVEEVICDNDRSASKFATKHRDGFERLTAMLRAGHVLVCWEASRLSRDMATIVAIRDLCLDRGVELSYGGSVVDLEDPTFLFQGVISEQESWRTRKRIQRSHRENLAAGKPHGRIPFGYRIIRDPRTGKSQGWEPDPAQAPLVQEAARRILDGEPLAELVRWIGKKYPLQQRESGQMERADEVSPAKGAHRKPGGWDNAKLRRLLENPTLAGFRTHSEVKDGVRGPQVIHGKGTWEPILTEEQHNELVALFAARKSGPRGKEPVHLLSGIATCGVCGERVWKRWGGKSQVDGRKWAVYGCPQMHAARQQHLADDATIAVVEGILTSPEALAALAEKPDTDPTAAARLAELRERLAAVEAALEDGSMPIATGGRVATQLEAQIAAAEEAAKPVFTDPAVREIATAADPIAMWRDWPVASKREFIKAALTVEIQRIGKGRWADKRKGIDINPRRRAG